MFVHVCMCAWVCATACTSVLEVGRLYGQAQVFYPCMRDSTSMSSCLLAAHTHDTHTPTRLSTCIHSYTLSHVFIPDPIPVLPTDMISTNVGNRALLNEWLKSLVGPQPPSTPWPAEATASVSLSVRGHRGSLLALPWARVWGVVGISSGASGHLHGKHMPTRGQA